MFAVFDPAVEELVIRLGDVLDRVAPSRREGGHFQRVHEDEAGFVWLVFDEGTDSSSQYGSAGLDRGRRFFASACRYSKSSAKATSKLACSIPSRLPNSWYT